MLAPEASSFGASRAKALEGIHSPQGSLDSPGAVICVGRVEAGPSPTTGNHCLNGTRRQGCGVLVNCGTVDSRQIPLCISYLLP